MTVHESDLSQPRAIPRESFAYLRGAVQGLPLTELWDRYLYLEGKSDLRRARRKLRYLKDIFRAAARREGKRGLGRLVSLDLTHQPTSEVSSLEAFAERFPEGFYGEAELAKLWAEEYGKPARTQLRRARLIERQLSAITWLENTIGEDPQAGDALSAWLEDKTSARLNKAGLLTLQDLVTWINHKGARWWTSIRGIGVEAGARILMWLQAHAAGGGWQLEVQASIPRRTLDVQRLTSKLGRVTDVVPLERFFVPEQLDGSQGLYRAPQKLCLIGAQNDYAAIQAWLAAKRGGHTTRSYRKEAERLLLWAILVCGKPLSSLTVEDCSAYRDFLLDPQPREQWCGPRGRERWSRQWRPFEGALTPGSARHALLVLKSLYAWLVDQCYLVGNPWKAIPAPADETPRLQVGRSFTAKQWAYLMDQLDTFVEDGALRRLRFALTFAYATGLRLAELVAARCEHLAWVEFEAGEGGFMLSVLGKGNKLREVPIPEEVMTDLINYLDDRGVDPDPRAASNQGVYLLGRIDDVAKRLNWPQAYDARAGISAATLYGQLKQFFSESAQLLAHTDEVGAARLAKASTHWLRHTHGTHTLAAGTPIEVVQNNLGHASLATTTLYVTAEKKRRHQAMQAFWRGRRERKNGREAAGAKARQ